MTVDNDNPFKAVTCNLLARCVQEIPHQTTWQSEGAGLMSCLIDLPVEEVRKYHGVLTLGRAGGPFTHMNQVRADRGMRAVLFQNADRQYACVSRLLQRLWPVTRSQLVPAWRERLGECRSA